MASNQTSFTPYQFGKTASCAAYFKALSPFGSRGNEYLEISRYRGKYVPKLAPAPTFWESLTGKVDKNATVAVFVNDFIEKNKHKLIKAVMDIDGETVDGELLSTLRKFEQRFPICKGVVGEILQTIEGKVHANFREANPFQRKEEKLESEYQRVQKSIKAQHSNKTEVLNRNFEISKRQLQNAFNRQKEVFDRRIGQIDNASQKLPREFQEKANRLREEYRQKAAFISASYVRAKQRKREQIENKGAALFEYTVKISQLKSDYLGLKRKERELFSIEQEKYEKMAESKKQEIQNENKKKLGDVSSTVLFAKAMYQKENADITILCKNNEKVFAQSLFLKGKSKFIDAKLAENPLSKLEDSEKLEIDLKRFSKETVRFILDYFYGIYKSVPLEIRFFAELLVLIKEIEPCSIKLLQDHELVILNSIEVLPEEIISQQVIQDLLIHMITEENAPELIEWLTEENLLSLLDQLEIKDKEFETNLLEGLIKWAHKRADDDYERVKMLLTKPLSEKAVFPLCDYIDFTLVFEHGSFDATFLEMEKLAQWKECYSGTMEISDLNFPFPQRLQMKKHWKLIESTRCDSLVFSIPLEFLLTNEKFVSYSRRILSRRFGWDYQCRFSQGNKEGTFQLSLIGWHWHIGDLNPKTNLRFVQKFDLQFSSEWNFPSKKETVSLENGVPHILFETTLKDLQSHQPCPEKFGFNLEFPLFIGHS